MKTNSNLFSLIPPMVSLKPINPNARFTKKNPNFTKPYQNSMKLNKIKQAQMEKSNLKLKNYEKKSA